MQSVKQPFQAAGPVVEPSSVIQATLAPIFLVSGAAIFLNFTQARLFRVVDRLRELGPKLREVEDAVERGRLLATRQRNLRRAVILRNAVLFGVLVIGLTVVTTLMLLTPSVFPGRVLEVGTLVIFASALLSFAVALVLVTIDAFLSVASAVLVSGGEFSEGLRPGE